MVDSHETPNMYPNLSALLNVSLNNQKHFRLNNINEIKDYFVDKIKERELMSKDLVNISLLLTIASFICNNR